MEPGSEYCWLTVGRLTGARRLPAPSGKPADAQQPDCIGEASNSEHSLFWQPAPQRRPTCVCMAAKVPGLAGEYARGCACGSSWYQGAAGGEAGRPARVGTRCDGWSGCKLGSAVVASDQTCSQWRRRPAAAIGGGSPAKPRRFRQVQRMVTAAAPSTARLQTRWAGVGSERWARRSRCAVLGARRVRNACVGI